MADKTPHSKAVNSEGFDKFASINKTAMDSLAKGNWPTLDEYSSAIKKTGGAFGSDTKATSFQFYDPAYFDPLLFFLQHRDRRELNFRLRWAYEYNTCSVG